MGRRGSDPGADTPLLQKEGGREGVWSSKRLLSLPNITGWRSGHGLSRGTRWGWGAPAGARSRISREWEGGEGRSVGRTQKNPRRRHSKGLKASTALRSGNGTEQESLREREDGKKSGMGEKRGLRRSRMGCIPSTCWSSSEPAGVKPSRGSPRINHRNKRVVLVRPQPARQERERIVIINNH